MAKSKANARGHQQAGGLEDALRRVAAAPLPGSRDLFVIRDLKPGGGFASSQDNVLVQVGQYLASTDRLFKFGGGVVFEVRQRGGVPRLVPLTEGGGVVPGAEHRLANLLVCADGDGQFSVPGWFAALLLRSEPLDDVLPEIKTYARRPVFDDEFVLRGPGWHKDVGILVHGPDIDPAAWVPPDPKAKAVERLPPHLKKLLGGFCFKSDADLVNALGLLLTALLVGRYVNTGKPLVLFDGNQPGLGKTWLARIVGLIADGVDPKLVRFTTDDEELHKRLCAHLRTTSGSVVVLDNAKVAAGGAISSPTLESLVTDPGIALRILGKSEVFERPNDVVWVITMNETKASADLVTRGLPIRLEYEGDPAARTFDVDPLKYARRHRVAILGELAGMVVSWNSLGRPPGTARHRFAEWAGEVGGVLAACGFPEFLENAGEAAGEFTVEGDELVALAEHVVGKGGPGLGPDPRFPKAQRLSPKEWVPVFAAAGVCADALQAAKNDQAKAIQVGRFFARLVGRSVTVNAGTKPLAVTLRCATARARGRVYFLEAAPDQPGTTTFQTASEVVGFGGNAPLPTAPAVPAEATTAEGNDENWG